MEKRKSDHASLDVTESRTSLIYKDEHGYWFKTREDIDFGPYESKMQALLGRQVFIYQVTGDLTYKPALPDEQQYLLDVEETTFDLECVADKRVS